MQQIIQRPATASGTFTIGGDLTVYRLGFGAMRLQAQASGDRQRICKKPLLFCTAPSNWG
jgi:hypothetical protein